MGLATLSFMLREAANPGPGFGAALLGVHLLLATAGVAAGAWAAWRRQWIGVLAVLICGFYLRLEWHFFFECCA